MSDENDYLKRFTDHVLQSIKSSQELQEANEKLKIATTKLRRIKIETLKNGSRKDKINLLIEERLLELENEERLYKENLKKQIEWLKAQSVR